MSAAKKTAKKTAKKKKPTKPYTREEFAKKRAYLRALVRMLYDVQKLRIQAGLRLNAAERGAADVLPHDQEKLGEISDALKEVEDRKLLREITYEVERHPLWPAFLQGVKGCGPTMAAVILAEIDIEVATCPSKLWRYAGQGVTDGRGDRLKRGERARYNPFLKAKMYLLGSLFLRLGNEKYRAIYLDQKNRLENKPCAIPLADHYRREGVKEEDRASAKAVKAWETARQIERERAALIVERCHCIPAHVHAKAQRAMIKIFLLDLYDAWRDVAGLPRRDSYAEEKLGLRHSD